MSPQTIEQAMFNVVEKIKTYQKPNSKNALRLLEAFDVDCFDGLDLAIELCEEYRDIDRADFDDTESYQEAKSDAWEVFIESLDDIEFVLDDDEEEKEDDLDDYEQDELFWSDDRTAEQKDQQETL